MKFLQLLLTLFLALALFSCEQSDETPLPEITIEDGASFQKAIRDGRPGYYLFPFNATGRTSGAANPQDLSGCAPGPFADQRGDGTLQKLGNFNVQFTFCVDPSTASQGFVNYFNALATFYLENGDEIYAEGEGTVFLNAPGSSPSGFFKDTFRFTGAKIDGEMKDASGFFRTDSEVFNSLTPEEFTNHKFNGILKIKS